MMTGVVRLAPSGGLISGTGATVATLATGVALATGDTTGLETGAATGLETGATTGFEIGTTTTDLGRGTATGLETGATTGFEIGTTTTDLGRGTATGLGAGTGATAGFAAGVTGAVFVVTDIGLAVRSLKRRISAPFSWFRLPFSPHA